MDTNPAVGSPTPSSTEPDPSLVSYLSGDEDSPAPVSSPAAPPVEAQPPTPAEQPRDEQGRFITPAETPAAAETPAPPAAEAPAPSPPVAPPESAPAKPFSYRAYGAEHRPFGDAVERPDGVLIPTPSVSKLRQVLAEGHNAESRRRQHEAEAMAKVTSARAARAEIVQRAELTLAKLAELRRDPEAFQTWFEDLDRNWSLLEAQVDRDRLAGELRAQQTVAQEAAQERQAAELEPRLRDVLERSVQDMVAQDAELRGLDVPAMSERLWGAFRRGEILIDYDVIRAELAYEAGLRRSAPPVPAAAPAVPSAVPRVAGEEKAPAPPIVPTKGAGARSGLKVPVFKSTQEADDWYERGGYHDLF